ncbi:unnamed protein product, partial [Musa textilis]
REGERDRSAVKAVGRVLRSRSTERPGARSLHRQEELVAVEAPRPDHGISRPLSPSSSHAPPCLSAKSSRRWKMASKSRQDFREVTTRSVYYL